MKSSVEKASFVLIDCEYTSWEGAMTRNWSAPGEHREVVQVAACGVASGSGSIVWESDWLTTPKLNPILSRYFTNLTGITQEIVAQRSVPLEQILSDLSVRGAELPFFSWGDGDEGALRESCGIQGILYTKYLPIISDIRPYLRNAGIAVSEFQSGTVHSAVGITMEGRPHNSLFDVQSMLVTIQHLVAAGRAAWPNSQNTLVQEGI